MLGLVLNFCVEWESLFMLEFGLYLKSWSKLGLELYLNLGLRLDLEIDWSKD